MLKILVLCDTSPESGLGHFTRTNSLVNELKKIGFSITWFFPIRTPSYILQMINSEIEKIIFFNDISEDFSKAFEENSDYLLIDSYNVNGNTRRSLSINKRFKKIISIQDQEPYQFADIFINHNYSKHKSEVSYLSDRSILFRGSDYLMLDYEKFKRIERYDCSRVQKVLISFGATCQAELILKTLNSLRQLHSNFVVRVYSNEKDYNVLKAAENCQTKNLEVEYSKIDPNESQKIHEFDICIGSFGVSAWERIYVGLPSLCLPIAENHMDVGKILDKTNAVIFTQPHMLERNISKVFNDRSLRLKMHLACKNLLDGQSTQRLAKELKQVLGQ